MTLCERCYRPTTEGEHGLFLCPLEPRRDVCASIIPDDIPGGVLIEHGLCNDDGTPRRYYSNSEIKQACAQKGLMRWTDIWEERRTNEGKERADWMRSGEYQRIRRDRREQRMERRASR